MKRRIIFFFILLSGFFLRLYFVLVSPYFKSSVHTCDICTIGLMAKHILGGEFPLFFYGQYYLGPLEAVVTSFFFLIFGIKMQIIYASVLFFSILFMVSTYFLAKMMRDTTTGLIALLYAAFPPSYFFGESVTPAGYHSEIPVLGNLLFIVTLLICRETSNLRKHVYYVILGILAGIGVWTHYIMLYYLLPAGLFLLLRERIWVLIKNSILTTLSGIFISLPFWIFTLQNEFATFKFIPGSSGEGLARYVTALKTFLDNTADMLGLGLGSIVYIVMALYFIFRGRLLLNIFFYTLLGIYIFYSSNMYGTSAFWYLIPLISFIPISFTYFCRSNRIIGICVITLIISFNIWDITGLIKRDTLESRQHEETRFSRIRFLDENRLDRIIGDDRPLREIEFYTNERIIGTGLGEGDYFPHEDEVGASDRIAFEHSGLHLDSTLDIICKSYKIGGGFYFDFEPFPYLIRSIIPHGWDTVSNRDPFSTKYAFDRNYNTLWLTGKTRHSGDWFRIDLGRIFKICNIKMFNVHHFAGYPMSYKVEVSIDGDVWKEIVYVRHPTPLFWSGPRPWFQPVFGRVECIFEPVEARYIRLTQIGDDSENPWEINEVFIYEYLGEKDFSLKDYIKEIKRIITFLKRHSISFLYADYWPSAKIKKLTKDRISVLVPYNSWRPFRKNMARDVYLGKDKAVLAAVEDTGELEDILKELHVNYKKKAYNRYICYYFPDLKSGEYVPSFVWTGIGLAKHSLKDYSSWLYRQGYYEEALRYYPNNFLAYLRARTLSSTRFFPKAEKSVLFVNGIKLLGYSIRSDKIIPGKVIRIEYFWEVIDEPKEPLSMFVYFMRDGKIVFQNDHAFLYQFSKPLSPLEGERFREVLKLKIPEDIQPGSYKIVIGLWNERENKRIYIRDSTGKKVSKQTVGELVVEKL